MMARALLSHAQGSLTFHCCKKVGMTSFGAAAGSGVCVDAAVLPQGVPRLALAPSNAGPQRMSVTMRVGLAQTHAVGHEWHVCHSCVKEDCIALREPGERGRAVHHHTLASCCST